MKILFSPTVHDAHIAYQFDGDKVTVTMGETVEEFDFTGLPDGRLDSVEPDFLPANPIIEAVKEAGVLSLKLLMYIGTSATQEECFPVEFDSIDRPFVESRKEAEVSGEFELEI